MYNAAVWFEIYVNDLERARAFYESLFDIELIPLPDTDGKYLMFPYYENIEGAGGSLVQSDNGKPSNTGSRVWLSCSDCNVQLNKVEKIGGRIIETKQDISPNEFAALIEDTEGNIVGLHSPA